VSAGLSRLEHLRTVAMSFGRNGDYIGMSGEWACATEGFGLIAYRAPLLRPEDTGAKWGDVADRIASTLVRPVGRGFIVETARVVAWARPKAPADCPSCQGRQSVRCPTCDGSGVIDHECPECQIQHEGPCRWCEDGAIPCREKTCDPPSLAYGVRPGRFYGHCFDRNLIARSLAFAPEAVEIVPYLHGKSLLHAAWMGTPDFVAVVMGLDREADGPAFGDRVDLQPPAVVSSAVR
jgi:hypothetical protein